jgi:opacity protein-like surface antigen
MLRAHRLSVPSTVPIILAIAISATCAMARAADPFGFYVGAGGGHSEVRSDLGFSVFGPLQTGRFDVASSTNGWKAMMGLKPLPVLGVEAGYLDFGSIDGSRSIPATVTQGGLNASAHVSARSPAVFAMLYLPIPAPVLDVFLKAGAAELKTRVNASAQATCPISLPCLPVFFPPYSASSSSTRAAYGAGVQLKFSSVGVRAEYERIHGSHGDPDLASVSVIYGF